MTTIIDDLAKEHARFRRYLGWYRDEIDRLSRGGEADYALLDMLARYFAQFPDELHHKKEDIVYARLEEKARGRTLSLHNLHDQHIELSDRARRFADIVGCVLIDQELPIERVIEAAGDYSAALIAHMDGEEEILFKPARGLFTVEDWSLIHLEIGEMYITGINLEKARQALALEQDLDACLQYGAADLSRASAPVW